MRKYRLIELFGNFTEKIEIYLRVHDLLVEKYFPKIFKKFKKLDF